MTDAEAWLAIAGLGAFHGLNPAMGWLFAVALGLHRQSRRTVWVSLLPIAAGHALSIAVVVGLLVAMGIILPHGVVRIASGLFLLGWAAFHVRFGHRHRVRVGMQAGLLGLGLWSFLMASAHGAGLMLWPVLMPFCLPEIPSAGVPGAMSGAAIGIGVHMLAMLVVTAAVAVAVYEWIGLEILKRAWINVDLLWTLALIAAGAMLLFGA
jgi:hypothetical protein